jgi:hyaluronate lyase
MKKSIRALLLSGLGIAALLVAQGWAFTAQTVYAADEYDSLRAKWEQSITGGIGYDPTDPDYAAVISRITTKAQDNWNTLNKAAGRTYLWSDLQGTTESERVTQAYTRLNAMALGYRTSGSSLYNNATLRTDVVAALDWMHANRYNTTFTSYDNWWDWEIGVPLQLNDITVLMYDALTVQQRTNYMAAVERFSPAVTMTGANRVWKSTVVGVRGVIVKNSAKIASARDGLSSVFTFTSSGDGFYGDGSFIQHGNHPYNGGYGAFLLQDIANLMYLLDASTWQVTHANRINVFKWVYSSFEPLMYRGAMMDMTMGRVMSRYNFQNDVMGRIVTRSVIRLSQFAPAADATAYKRMVKQWIQTDTAHNFYSDASMNMAVLAKDILDDSNITPRGDLSKNVQFNSMARAVQHRPGYAFGISMHSSRIANYESFSTENTRGWHMSDGMTYLYNGDQTQFSDAFWPTVNSYRLPGTTVEQNTTIPPAKASDQLWTGGTELEGYGTTGMAIHPYGQTLNARKSWFTFDDEVVALGAGITATDNRVVETIVENRKLNSAGNNVLTVNNVAKPTAIPWSETMGGVQWAHLGGSAAGSDIGYYFPGSSTIKGQREARTDKWSSINNLVPFVNTTSHTRNYLSMWFDHGNNPNNAAYSYVLLPNKSVSQVSSYAGSPNITILRNDRTGQAVRENTLKITGANFWGDGGIWMGDIWSNKKSSVMMKEGANGSTDVSISDPMFANTGTFTVEIARAGGAVISKDAAITVTQLTPTIKMTVNATNLNGRVIKANFAAPVMPSKSTFSGIYGLGRLNTGTRTIEYDVTPQINSVNGTMGFADTSTAVTAFTSMSIIVRASTAGHFDAIHGTSSYQSVTPVPYVASQQYHVKIVADIPAKTYSAYITPPGGTPTLIASNYSFRSGAPAMDDLGKIVLKTDADNQLKVENLTVY